MEPEEQDRVPEVIEEGRYINCLQVGHNAFEFLMDFGQTYSDSDSHVYHTRLVSTPIFAVRVARLLQESIEQYERTFGQIPDDVR